MGTEAGRDAKERERERETVSDASVGRGQRAHSSVVSHGDRRLKLTVPTGAQGVTYGLRPPYSWPSSTDRTSPRSDAAGSAACGHPRQLFLVC